MKKLFTLILCFANISFGESIINHYIVKDISLSHEVLHDYLVHLNAWYPDILVMQARIESGNYTSAIYNDNNNLFGMRPAKKRPHTQTGSNRGYATYSNWRMSVKDRLLWDLHTFKYSKPSRLEYIEKLKTYAVESDYINKFK